VLGQKVQAKLLVWRMSWKILRMLRLEFTQPAKCGRHEAFQSLIITGRPNAIVSLFIANA
jgi:hypothetical protein